MCVCVFVCACVCVWPSSFPLFHLFSSLLFPFPTHTRSIPRSPSLALNSMHAVDARQQPRNKGPEGPRLRCAARVRQGAWRQGVARSDRCDPLFSSAHSHKKTARALPQSCGYVSRHTHTHTHIHSRHTHCSHRHTQTHTDTHIAHTRCTHTPSPTLHKDPSSIQPLFSRSSCVTLSIPTTLPETTHTHTHTHAHTHTQDPRACTGPPQPHLFSGFFSFIKPGMWRRRPSLVILSLFLLAAFGSAAAAASSDGLAAKGKTKRFRRCLPQSLAGAWRPSGAARRGSHTRAHTSTERQGERGQGARAHADRQDTHEAHTHHTAHTAHITHITHITHISHISHTHTHSTHQSRVTLNNPPLQPTHPQNKGPWTPPSAPRPSASSSSKSRTCTAAQASPPSRSWWTLSPHSPCRCTTLRLPSGRTTFSRTAPATSTLPIVCAGSTATPRPPLVRCGGARSATSTATAAATCRAAPPSAAMS